MDYIRPLWLTIFSTIAVFALIFSPLIVLIVYLWPAHKESPNA